MVEHLGPAELSYAKLFLPLVVVWVTWWGWGVGVGKVSNNSAALGPSTF